MPVAAVRVVNVVAVLDGLVTAARTVHMVVSGMGQMRQRVLVVVPLVWRMRMAFVDVIRMALALSAGVAAARAMDMLWVNVCVMVSGCHGPSLLRRAASATMCAMCDTSG
jgi:hypothetical protein